MTHDKKDIWLHISLDVHIVSIELMHCSRHSVLIRVATSLWSAEARFICAGGQTTASCSQTLRKTIAIVLDLEQKIHC